MLRVIHPLIILSLETVLVLGTQSDLAESTNVRTGEQESGFRLEVNKTSGLRPD